MLLTRKVLEFIFQVTSSNRKLKPKNCQGTDEQSLEAYRGGLWEFWANFMRVVRKSKGFPLFRVLLHFY